MTRNANARVAGVAFLVYIGVTFSGTLLFTRATSGRSAVEQIAGIARHATDVRCAVLLGLAGSLCALVLAVTLYSITRNQDPDLALLALTCRVAEGIGGMDVSRSLGLLWLATGSDAPAIQGGGAIALGAFFLKTEASFSASAAFFAIGSTIFSWLLLRGRLVPAALAWFGVLSSILPLIIFPLQLVGLVAGAITSLMWFPVILFEFILALWLIVKGVALSAPRGDARHVV